MKPFHYFGNIQKRILFLTLSCILGMCLIVSSASYYIFRNYLQQNMIHSTETNLQLLSDTINTSINDIYRMVRFCQTNSDIASYVKNDPAPNSRLAVKTYDRMLEEYNNNPYKAYMPRVAVITNNHFLQICDAAYSTTANLAEEVPNLPYFDALLSSTGYQYSLGMIADPFRKNRTIIPIIRPITYKYNSVQGGYLFLEVSSELFTSPLSKYSYAEDSNIFLTMNTHHYYLENGSFTKLSEPYEIIDGATDTALLSDTVITHVRNSDGQKQVIVSTPLNMAGCYISQSISNNELQTQKLLFFGILCGILIGIIAIGILLMFMMNQMIHIPVAKLRYKIQQIAEGDFSTDSAIEWNHELGDIGRGINSLSESVTLLMNKRIEDEKQKKELEYQMLQNQINPHFIYNTLNSIKWMASTQGASGICEMTTALGRLLKSISKGTQLLVPIREELSFLEDYFTIQNYRYGGMITFDIKVDDPLVYDCMIIKFTLQPLVENAIFHGIEPKGNAGIITIHACYETSKNNDTRDICIDVTDDGVGISAEKAAQILSGTHNHSADFFKKIGVSNVHKRLQYEFGEQYGITIDSVLGQYTTMSVRIPERPKP